MTISVRATRIVERRPLIPRRIRRRWYWLRKITIVQQCVYYTQMVPEIGGCSVYKWVDLEVLR